MADDQDNDQDENNERTPEQRIASLESGRKLSIILISVLAVLFMLQLGGLVTFILTSGDTRPDRNADAIAALDIRIGEIQDASKTIEAFTLQAQVLEVKLDRVLGETDLNNFASLRTLMQQQEESYTSFIKTLQQGMYDLSRMLRGSRTWYEVYKEDLDGVLQGSDARMLQLKGMAPPDDKKKK